MRGCASMLPLAVCPAAQYDADIRLHHTYFALLFVADYPSGRHRRVVHQGFRVKIF